MQGDSKLHNASIKSCNLKLSRSEDLLALVVEYGDESGFPNCFADNADDDSIYCKLRETNFFTHLSPMSQDRLCDLALMCRLQKGTKQRTLTLMKSWANKGMELACCDI